MFPFDQLWHYSEKFTRDQDLRQDLVLMAWQMNERLSEKSDIRLLKNYMKLRAKEISYRNSLGKEVGGKSKLDAYSQPRVSIFKRVCDGNQFCLADTLTSVARDPLGTTIVNEFEDALSPEEHIVCDAIVSGYPAKDVKTKLAISQARYQELKSDVMEKAARYLG